MMKHARWGVAAGALVGAMLLAQPAAAAFTSLFTGSITPTDGTAVAAPAPGPWGDSVLAYEVFYDDSAGIGQPITWKYKYTFTDTGTGNDIKEVSHMVVETSSNFLAANVFDGTTFKGTTNLEGPKTHTSGAGNPNMPSNVYGLKFDDDTGSTVSTTRTTIYEIVTDRAPVYGDAYLKDGKTGGQGGGDDITFYNAGFGNPDSDPALIALAPITDLQWLAIFQATDPKAAFDAYYCNAGNDACFTALSKHVLVPDTVVVNVVPIPAALPMLGAAIAGLGFAGWRRNRARA